MHKIFATRVENQIQGIVVVAQNYSFHLEMAQVILLNGYDHGWDRKN